MNTKTILSLIIAAASATAYAQDDTQASLRENPDIEASKGSLYVAPKIDYPAYVNLDANHINMNGADWSRLADALDSARTRRINIVHIGDSHLQADMGTAVTRTRLGDHYSSAGRSLIVPFKLAGTNEPVDYAITSATPMTQSRLLKTPWPTAMRLTGIGIEPQAKDFDLDISAREPFDSVTVYYSGSEPCLTSSFDHTAAAPGTLGIALPDTTSAVTLSFSAAEGTAIHGFNLLRGDSGVAYHVIGNNGATFGTYNGVDSFAEDVAAFSPELIILSLGTNEAFNKTGNDDMWNTISTLVSDLRRTCPDAALLLTTPSECQRKTTRRRRRRRTTSFSVNTNVKRMRDVIIGYARTEGIPVYDFYNVAGGTGSSFKWIKDSTLNKDRIHMTRAGYRLQGHLFTDALEAALENARKKNSQ